MTARKLSDFIQKYKPKSNPDSSFQSNSRETSKRLNGAVGNTICENDCVVVTSADKSLIHFMKTADHVLDRPLALDIKESASSGDVSSSKPFTTTSTSSSPTTMRRKSPCRSKTRSATSAADVHALLDSFHSDKFAVHRVCCEPVSTDSVSLPPDDLDFDIDEFVHIDLGADEFKKAPPDVYVDGVPLRTSKSENNSPSVQRRPLEDFRTDATIKKLDQVGVTLEKQKSSDKKAKEGNVRVIWNSLPENGRYMWVSCAILLFVCLLPVSSFRKGAILGAITVFILYRIVLFLSTPSEAVKDDLDELAPLEDLPPFSVPSLDQAWKEVDLAGWMHEPIRSYTPPVNTDVVPVVPTRPVHVLLRNSKLILSRPRGRFGAVSRRAMGGEVLPEIPEDCDVQEFEVFHGQVFLLPAGLVKKQVWSRKFPICLLVCPPAELPLVKSASTSCLTDLLKDSPKKEERVILFARSAREKEEWYRVLKNTSFGIPRPRREDISISTPKSSKSQTLLPPRESPYIACTRRLAPWVPDEWLGRQRPPCDHHVVWVNALLCRAFWDFFREPVWMERVKERVQTKLSKINLNQFIDELTIVDMDLGSALPVIKKTGRPYLDNRGLWMDLDIDYSGGFGMSLQTKINLLKLKDYAARKKAARNGDTSGSGQDTKGVGSQKGVGNVGSGGPRVDGDSPTQSGFSEADDSSSSESELEELDDVDGSGSPNSTVRGATSRRLLRLVDRIASSDYFNRALDNKFIQRGMQYVSNTTLELQVDLELCRGKLALNIPPPPSDRLWYGFHGNPELKLTAKPKVGQKHIRLSRIIRLIEKKLLIEFQRVLVLPNMNDVAIPLMSSGNPENIGH